MKTVFKTAVGLMTVTSLFVSSCTENKQNEVAVNDNKEDKNRTEQIQSLEAQHDSLQDLFATTLNDIDQNLQLIKEKEGMITLGEGSDAEKGIPQKERIIRAIQMINSLMQENEEKLTALNTTLNNYKYDNKKLKKLIRNTELVLKEREQQIAELRANLEKNNYDMQSLSEKLKDADVKNQMLQDYANKFEKQSYTGYFAYGTYKELEQEGVIKRKGGVLGLGKKTSVDNRFNDEAYTKIDIREITSFPIEGKNVKLITPHPAESYEIKEFENNEISSLEIKDPEKFWKASKYMVLAVK